MIEYNNKQSQKVVNSIKRPIWTAIKGVFSWSSSKKHQNAQGNAPAEDLNIADWDVVEDDRATAQERDAPTAFDVVNAAEEREAPLSEIQQAQIKKREQMNTLID